MYLPLFVLVSRAATLKLSGGKLIESLYLIINESCRSFITLFNNQ